MVAFTHILCPIDFSDSSDRALAQAAALARRSGARLTALHVVPTFDPRFVRTGDWTDPLYVASPVPRDEVLQAVQRALDAAGPASDRTVAAAEAGDAAAVIVDQSLAARADLIVMGTHGRTGLDRALLGSVTEKVLHKAACPVLTVPPHAPAETTDRADAAGFRRVVCAMDFSASAMQALGFARDLAHRAGGRVVVVHAIEFLPEDDPDRLSHFNIPRFRGLLAAQTREKLDAILAQVSQPGDDLRPLVVNGRAHQQILRIAGEESADLIVMGAHGHDPLVRAIFGSTTQHVVRAAHCPVLTVRTVSLAGR